MSVFRVVVLSFKTLYTLFEVVHRLLAIFSSSVSKKMSSYCDRYRSLLSSSSSLSCKNYNVAHYSKSKLKGINTKLGILAHHDNVQMQDKGHNSEKYIFGVMHLFN